MDMQWMNRSEQPESSAHLGTLKVIRSSTPTLEKSMTDSRQKSPLMKRLMRWLVPDQRVANRHTMPPVVAYLGMLRSSKLYKIGDISVAGFYMITDERWINGTGFPVTLERTDDAAQGSTLTVFSTVVRATEDGVAFTFLPSATEGENSGETQGASRIDLTKLAHFLKGLPLSDPSSDTVERAS
jgi:hypothetical protein